jgi:regulator of protease activity HflC (stomatin/prohibitin superfamily)
MTRLTRILGGGIALFAAFIFMSSIYTVETGHVAVERTLGRIDVNEVGEGIQFKMPILTQQETYVAKEINFTLEDLRPKAADNLSLKDLDVTVYYKVLPTAIAEIDIKYAGTRARGDGAWYPAYGLVHQEARGAAYDAVSQIESLELHKSRDQLGRTIAEMLQNSLDQTDKGTFTITRVIIRALNTDPSIEKSIQLAVQNEKKLEAKKLEVQIAYEDAQIEIERAKGIAEANRIINQSLTPEYLQHEINTALKAFADNSGSVVVIPANMQGFDMILDAKSISKPQ